MNAAAPTDHPDEGAQGEIAQGNRLVRVGSDKGRSLGERLADSFHRLTWRTPLHSFRLNGRYPLKLLAVPQDPFGGDPVAGQALIDGAMTWHGQRVTAEAIDFGSEGSPALVDHVLRFAWLRDLAAAPDQRGAAVIAEALMRVWLERHGDQVTAAAWRPDLVGWRILFWTAHAPLILATNDLVYRSRVLNALARSARHLDRGADRGAEGKARLAAWAGIVAAGLLIPGGDPRRAYGESGLQRTILATLSDDGGVTTRSPSDQVEVIELLTLLRASYDARRVDRPDFIDAALHRAVAALQGVTLSDGALSSWQGAGPIGKHALTRLIMASEVRTRPLRQARDWGYQRMTGGASVVVMDAAPPPSSRLGTGGAASTLAFELSDGPNRLIVNCGGSSGPLPPGLARGLRTTAAHSTLVIGDSNSTAIHSGGTLGHGVRTVELDRNEGDSGSRITASHDGYAKRFGFNHRRALALSADGRELHGEDALIAVPRRGRSVRAAFAVRFHLAPGVEATPTADGQAALLRIDHGPLWQMRCRGAALRVEESLWIDAAGRPVPSLQLVLSGEAPTGGAAVSWLLKRAG